jgi:oligoendopeptidase F
MSSIVIKKPLYQYLKSTIKPEWEVLEFYFNELLNRNILSDENLLTWLKDRSELEAYLEEDSAWRYIHMTSDTTREDYKNAFIYFTEEIEPKMAPIQDSLNKKLMAVPYLKNLPKSYFSIFLKKIETQIELFRKENIPLITELQLKQQEYAQIAGAMQITLNGEVYTMEQGATFLKSTDRDLRKQAFELMASRRLLDKKRISELFTELVFLRQKIAHNAGFGNFRDYSFTALGRFDYGPSETANFGEAIRQEIVPILKTWVEQRKQSLGLDELKPWDMDVDISGKQALKPFQNGEELIDKTITCFTKLDPFFGECLEVMKKENYFDVESRLGKAPGGYNYPLAESGAPFIFMNSANSFRDLTTMVHEGGHAIHTFLTKGLLLNDFKHLTSEIAELASMSMELLSMKYWNVFFEKPEDLKRAKNDQMVDSLKTFPWVAIIDRFQDRLYTEPYSVRHLSQIWDEIYKDFGNGFCDWSGYEDYRDHIWQKQLHLFEVPFYYIEYGIAGLGAIAVWKNFTENPDKAIHQYKEALSLGYTRSISEVYKTAGIRFDLSQKYISNLAKFACQQMDLE